MIKILLRQRKKQWNKHDYKAPWKERIVPWLFLAPSLFVVSVMVLLPLLDAFRRSFFLAVSSRFVGLQNYISVLGNSAFKLAAGNTAKFIAVCMPLLLVISLSVALMLTAFQEKHGIFKTSFLVPMAIPVASIVLLWRVIFHRNGLLNGILALWDAAPVDWIGSAASFGVLVFAYLWKNFGYDMVLWLSGISAINPALYEAAQIDGAGTLRCFVHVVMPVCQPVLGAAIALSFADCWNLVEQPLTYLTTHTELYPLSVAFNQLTQKSTGVEFAGAALYTLPALFIYLFFQNDILEGGQLTELK